MNNCMVNTYILMTSFKYCLSRRTEAIQEPIDAINQNIQNFTKEQKRHLVFIMEQHHDSFGDFGENDTLIYDFIDFLEDK